MPPCCRAARCVRRWGCRSCGGAAFSAAVRGRHLREHYGLPWPRAFDAARCASRGSSPDAGGDLRRRGRGASIAYFLGFAGSRRLSRAPGGCAASGNRAASSPATGAGSPLAPWRTAASMHAQLAENVAGDWGYRRLGTRRVRRISWPRSDLDWLSPRSRWAGVGLAETRQVHQGFTAAMMRRPGPGLKAAPRPCYRLVRQTTRHGSPVSNRRRQIMRRSRGHRDGPWSVLATSGCRYRRCSVEGPPGVRPAPIPAEAAFLEYREPERRGVD